MYVNLLQNITPFFIECFYFSNYFDHHKKIAIFFFIRFAPFFGCNAILPVELISFTAYCENQKAVLKWYSTAEIANDYYSKEMSNDGLNWLPLGIIKSKYTAASTAEYVFKDVSVLNNDTYYRLIQTDVNGRSNYLGVVFLENCTKSMLDFMVYPNPTSDIINIDYEGDKNKISSITINNMNDEKVFHSMGYSATIDLSGFSEGIYIFHIQVNEKMIRKKIALRK